MPAGTPYVPILVIGAVASDSVAAWIGAASLVSAGALHIVQNWVDIRRKQRIQDMTDSVDFWKRSCEESERLRDMERRRNEEAEKTFRLILEKKDAEIVALRMVVSRLDFRSDMGTEK